MQGMNNDIFTEDRSRRSRRNSYYYYLLNTFLNLLPPSAKYPVFKILLGEIGKKTVVEPGAFFSGFRQIFLGRDVFVGRHSSFYAYTRGEEKTSITVGDHVLIAPHSVITTLGHDYNNLQMTNRCQSIIIEQRVWVGAGSIVLPGVTLREGSIVAAGAVVTQSVPSWKIVAGCPARIVKDRPHLSGSGDRKVSKIEQRE